MKSKIIVSALLLASQINMVSAGMVATTVHSRANCHNNESITWWFNHPYEWRVVSTHTNIYGTDRDHLIDRLNVYVEPVFGQD